MSKPLAVPASCSCELKPHSWSDLIICLVAWHHQWQQGHLKHSLFNLCICFLMIHSTSSLSSYSDSCTFAFIDKKRCSRWRVESGRRHAANGKSWVKHAVTSSQTKPLHMDFFWPLWLLSSVFFLLVLMILLLIKRLSIGFWLATEKSNLQWISFPEAWKSYSSIFRLSHQKQVSLLWKQLFSAQWLRAIPLPTSIMDLKNVNIFCVS